ncbi:MAG: CinA family protein [Aestuariivita sp.]|nr:CinA family protein [Aestuariivita sp.]
MPNKTNIKLVKNIIELARQNDMRITTAESCTGGMLISTLTDLPGASSVIDCGFVTYSNEAKIDLLNVRKATLKTYGAVSEEVALQMAEGALEKAKAEVAISITGIAGPGGTRLKPEGLVYFGITTSKTSTKTKKVEFGSLGRNNVRIAACNTALGMLLNEMSKSS